MGSSRRSTGAIPAAIAVGGLSLVAIGGLISRSLRPNAIVGGELGTGAWSRVLSDPAFRDAVQFTVLAALIATAIAVVIAIPLGLALRTRGPRTNMVMGLLIPVPP